MRQKEWENIKKKTKKRNVQSIVSYIYGDIPHNISVYNESTQHRMNEKDEWRTQSLHCIRIAKGRIYTLFVYVYIAIQARDGWKFIEQIHNANNFSLWSFSFPLPCLSAPTVRANVSLHHSSLCHPLRRRGWEWMTERAIERVKQVNGGWQIIHVHAIYVWQQLCDVSANGCYLPYALKSCSLCCFCCIHSLFVVFGILRTSNVLHLQGSMIFMGFILFEMQTKEMNKSYERGWIRSKIEQI